jgi:hypothetical protein
METQEARDAREEMESFVEWLLQFFDALLKEARNGPLFNPFVVEGLTSAWPEFLEDFSSSRWQELVRDIPENRLEEHGLYGQQLWLKLWLIRYWLERFYRAQGKATAYPESAVWTRKVEAPARNAAASSAPASGRSVGSIKDAFKKLIEGIDIFLESLTTASGMNGAIVEIKKLFGMAVDE